MLEVHRNREEAVAQPEKGSSCACGGHDSDLPELDAQAIPHAVRHAAIFGALDALHPGKGLILSATHNPLPLLAQLADRRGDDFTTEYVEDGPERWRIKIVRR